MADRQESTSGTEETQSEDQAIELNCDDTTSTPLDHSWRVFYTPSIAKGVQASNEEFESALRDIGSFDTVEVCRNIFFMLFFTFISCAHSLFGNIGISCSSTRHRKQESSGYSEMESIQLGMIRTMKTAANSYASNPFPFIF